MTERTFSGDAVIKLTRLVDEGMRTLHEIDSLREGLSETVKAVAEELEIKPSVLKKAIAIAHKASLTDENKKQSEINTILELTGKTL